MARSASTRSTSSCQPTFVVDGQPVRTRIKVVGYPNRRKVRVATLTDDGREVRVRWLNASQLYGSAITPTGQPRRTGYRLVDEANHDDEP